MTPPRTRPCAGRAAGLRPVVDTGRRGAAPGGIVLKAKETWPGTGKVYCHGATGWPNEPDLAHHAVDDSALSKSSTGTHGSSSPKA